MYADNARERRMSKVIISNGFSKFHLAVAAAEAHRRGLLSLFVTGAYPTPAVRRLAAGVGLLNSRKIGRLVARGEAIPDTLVRPMWISEGIQQASMLARRLPPFASARALMDRYSFKLYARRAAEAIREIRHSGQIYHYRAGFGHESVRVAKGLGMIALCDHSITHPAVLEHLVTHQGRLPPPGVQGAMSGLWTDILHDIEQADAVLVNSQFVKETFIHQGWDPARVHVIYLGIDEQFMNAVTTDARGVPDAAATPRVLFAGALDRRKGAESLLAALPKLGNAHWRLDIAGVIAPDIGRRFRDVLGDPRVAVRGTLPRTELASLMTDTDVFVFPSLCEGSARVVFEALACGCYVITTENAGSIVEDGVHGALVPPADPEALAAALRRALGDRAGLAETGRRNADLIRRCYQQSRYGESLGRLYASLLAEREGGARIASRG